MNDASGPAMKRQTAIPVSARPAAARTTFFPVAAFFHRILDRIDAGLAHGTIEALLPDGTRRVLGARGDGVAVIVHLVRWRSLLRLVTSGSSGWYVAWSRGEWTSPDPAALFEVFSLNRRTLGPTGRSNGLTRRVRRWINALRRNSRSGARRNIAAHYDLGNDFYTTWLDPTLSYSSGKFESSDESLEQAQRRKLLSILARTATVPGDRLLEIGCGWGSFVDIAAGAGRRVHAITLSAEQQQWVAGKDYPGVDVTLTDYRDVTGTYDGIASIEMVEAVGQAYWPDYLKVIAGALRPGGRAALQYIAIDDAIFDAYATNVDFIQRHVFPGGMLLSRRQFRALADGAGLDWEDDQSFGLDYAETLRRWRDAFDMAVEERRLPPRFDPKFINLWRFYLMYCEGGFRGGGIDVAQVTLVKR